MMVNAIVSFSVQKLGEFLIQEAVFLQEVRGEVEWLKIELGYMQSFIKDAEEKQGGNQLVRQWASELTSLAYDAVDILESFTNKVEADDAPKQKIMDCIRSYACICNKKAKLYNIGKEIQTLKKRVIDLSRRRDAYGIRSIGNSGEGTSSGQKNGLVPRQLRRATSYADEEHVIGFEDVADTLLAELLKDERRRCVVSIYGMGGLGKTTLARKLYNSAKATSNFHCRAWICVSQEYRIQDLLQSIIKSFNKGCNTSEELDKLDKMNLEDLERHLREFLKGSRYLVVIDDVWHKEAWQSLRRAFPDSKNGSRVIITTRNKDVAVRADDRSFVHELRFLRPEESWELFCKKAFREDQDAGFYRPPALEKLGEEMVAKCNGLPLAIIVLGGLLAHKEGPEEWYKVREDLWRHLKNDSVEISELLSLSYNDLSPEVKQCFLYLGMFPEDYVIYVEKLILLWVAEEIIPEGEERLEDVAEKYFNELINRSLIQVAATFWERIVKCRVHDLLRDLALQKATEVIFFDVFDQHKHFAPLVCRRHVVHSKIQSYFSLHLSNSKLRSLVFFNPDGERPKIERVAFICREFKLLRVLDLDHFFFGASQQLPDVIGELIHLKFLGLKDAHSIQLPPSIGKLKTLQTLMATGSSCKLPLEICQLKELRHILTFPEGRLNVDNLTNLQTLRYVTFNQWIEINPVSLINLRELALYERIPSSFSLDSVTKLDSLSTLILIPLGSLPPLQPLSSCQRLLKLWLHGWVEKLPALHELPQSLTMLTLSKLGLEKDPMPTLEMLPQLRSLDLGYGSYYGKKIVCSAKGFCQLEFLRLNHLPELEDWLMDNGAMPMIRGLGIYHCKKLTVLPKRLKSLPAIRESDNIYWVPGYDH